jgi:hypothetical protein
MNAPELEKPELAAADTVNQPSHYQAKDGSGIESIQAIRAQMPADQFEGWLRGNAAKYLWRYQDKGRPVEDLRKARFYIEQLIELHNAPE